MNPSSCSRFAAEICQPVSIIVAVPQGINAWFRRCYVAQRGAGYLPRTSRVPWGLNWGTAVNRQKIWRRPSVSAYLQTGARWLLGRGLPPARLPSPVMHAASPMNGPTPRRTMTTWNIVRGVGVALASPNDNCACGDARMHQFQGLST